MIWDESDVEESEVERVYYWPDDSTEASLSYLFVVVLAVFGMYMLKTEKVLCGSSPGRWM